MKVKFAITLFVIAMTIAACSTGAASTPTLPPFSTGTPAAATATAAAPSTTGTVQPTLAPPTPMLTITPPATAGPLPSGDLSDSQMSTIVTDSLAAYPWTMDFHAEDQAVSQAITGTVKAESSTRLEIDFEQPISGTPVIADLILITPTLYANVSGMPSDVLQAAGLQDGKWGKVAPTQDILGLWGIADAAAQPAYLIMGLGFQSLLVPSTTGQTPFKLSGTEQVNGVQTNVYERQVTDTSATFTYRVNVGTADSRIYEMQASGPVTSTITMAYDQSLNIQPPIP
jgi:hypothetical protein